MNPNLKQVRIRKCVVCDYSFAQEHHVYPRRKEGGKNEILLLCPNHHHFANLIQVMIENGSTMKFIRDFAHEDFDTEFNEFTLEYLLHKYFKYLTIDIYERVGVNAEYSYAKNGKSLDSIYLGPDDSINTFFSSSERGIQTFKGVPFEQSLFDMIFSSPIKYAPPKGYPKTEASDSQI